MCLLPKKDKRSVLHKLLLNYRPLNQHDRKQCARILSFIKRNKNCFERTNLSGHITGSAWVVDKEGSRVLLTHHKKLNKWLQLGGHADGNFNVPAVALREAKEESGINGLKFVSHQIFDLDVHLIPRHKREPAHYHYDIRFLLKVTGSDKFKVGDESHQLAWVPIEKITEFTREKSIVRMAKKWKILNRF